MTTLTASLLDRFAATLAELFADPPQSAEPLAADPVRRASELADQAARRTATLSGALALPLGPTALLALLPDLLLVWRVQAQLVADIASAYGKKAHLGREQLLYCLFRYSAAQAVRGLVERNGQRWLVRQVSQQAFKLVLARVGVKASQSLTARAASRLVPVLGAVGVAAYAYYDTQRIARTAVELFERDIVAAPATQPA